MSAAGALPIYPNCAAVTRTVRVGGMTKRDLLSQFQTHGIELNEAGQALFADDAFETSETSSVLETVEISVLHLGYPQGATIAQVHERSAQLGLTLCPLELGPHLRLQYLDQPEGCLGYPILEHQAPPGSLTVASRQLAEDDNTPRGFYLRRIKGTLWLRGYRSSAGHIWSPEDHFVFCRSNTA